MTTASPLADDYDLPRLEARLPSSWQLRYFAEIESTNDWALNQFRNQAPALPTLALARLQSRGRGQADRVWKSAAGNLTCSLAFQLSNNAQQAAILSWPARLAIATALATWDTASNLLSASTCEIKWPNDLLVDQHKAAGILIETCLGSITGTDSTRAPTAVVGIGLNVNVHPLSENSNVAAHHSLKPTSFAAAAGHPFDLTDVLITLSQKLALRLSEAGVIEISNHFTQTKIDEERLIEQFNQILAWRNQSVSVRQGENQFQGILLGLNRTGQLLIETSEETLSFAAGELRPLE